MENPLYDVIIGNVPGVSDEDNNRLEAQAVVTRAQAKQQIKPFTWRVVQCSWL